MKRYKKIISLSLSMMLITTLSFSTYGNSVKALELTKLKKISSVLLEEMDDLKTNETVPIYVEFEDNITKDYVEQKVDTQTGMSLEQLEELEMKLLKSEDLKYASEEELKTLLPEYFEDTESKREYIQGLVDDRIMAERSISKELYDEQNAKYVKQTGIDDTDIEFVSSYSPMVITNCTEDEIEDIVIHGNVKSIDIHEDVQINIENDVKSVDVNENIETTPDSNISEAVMPLLAINETYVWKSAIRADYTTNTIGITGKGVTVGVFDGDTVNKSHEDLKNTDITVLDKVTDYDDYHCTKVTRVLAGSYGIVPKAKVYTFSTISTQATAEEAIEKLIKKGVSLINMSLSFGKRESDYYTQFEKWLDHVSYSHDVLIVNAAGNVDDKDGDVNCPIGALSYNALTVGGINTKNTETYSDDRFHKGTCYANGNTLGCAKPDCEAAYNKVLQTDAGYSGTSLATPAVTGVCAQVIQTEPTLVFHPEVTKAIIMASCDRKGTESYANGLTAKEGSGVVNAFKAVIIASTGRYKRKVVFPYDSNPTANIDYVKRGTSTSKIVMCWQIPSFTYGDDYSGYAESSGNYDFNLGVYSSKGKLIKESKIYNSSAEAVVFNSESDTLELRFKEYYMYTNHAYEIGIAWYK